MSANSSEIKQIKKELTDIQKRMEATHTDGNKELPRTRKLHPQAILEKDYNGR